MENIECKLVGKDSLELARMILIDDDILAGMMKNKYTIEKQTVNEIVFKNCTKRVFIGYDPVSEEYYSGMLENSHKLEQRGRYKKAIKNFMNLTNGN